MGHTLTKLLYHCTFSTKGRRPLLKGTLSDELNAFIAGTAANIGAHLVRAGGTADHRHLLLEIRPADNLSDVVRAIKANSSRWLRRSSKEMNQFAWQIGYAAFTVSESARDKVAAYIARQAEHHAEMSFEEELVKLLARHGVSYDPRDLAG